MFRNALILTALAAGTLMLPSCITATATTLATVAGAAGLNPLAPKAPTQHIAANAVVEDAPAETTPPALISAEAQTAPAALNNAAATPATDVDQPGEAAAS